MTRCSVCRIGQTWMQTSKVGDYRVIFEIDQNSTPIIIKIDEVRKRDEQTY